MVLQDTVLSVISDWWCDEQNA